VQRNRAIIWAIFITTLALSAAALTLPIPGTWPTNTVGFHQQLIVNIIMACTHLGGALLFMTNLDVYKAKLRRAYIVLSIGTIVIGMGTLQISILTILNAWETPYGQSGATMLPFLLSGLILYLGVRSFARLVEVKHVLTKAWIVMPTALVLAFLSTLLPHANDPRIPEITYDVLVGISSWSGSFLLLSAIIVMKVRQQAGAHYDSAMKWLTRTLFFSSFVLFFQAFYTSINSEYDPTLNNLSNLVTVMSGIMWIRAGYAFALTKYYNEDIPLMAFIFGQNETSSRSRPKTVIDMVTYAAGLVSNSNDIDPMLDSVRSITSRLKPGETPTVEDRRSLVNTYLKIENYLITEEAIRKFSRKELRSQLDPSLEKLLTDKKA